jgi:hypothetical protein
LAVLLSSLAFGCGGSSQPEALTKPEFLKQANAICAEAQEERAAQSKGLSESDSSAEAGMQQLLEPVEKMTGELGDLGPPAGDQKEVEAIVAAYEDGTAALEAEPAGAEAASAYAQANKLAAMYGLTDCSI